MQSTPAASPRTFVAMDPLYIGLASAVGTVLCSVIGKLYLDNKAGRAREDALHDARLQDLREYTAALVDVQGRIRDRLQEHTAEERDRLLTTVDDLLGRADPPKAPMKSNTNRRLRP